MFWGHPVYSGELFAILLALEWIEEYQSIQACLSDDCLNALQTNNSQFNSSSKLVCDIRYALLNIEIMGSTVEFVWIPGHRRVFGNEAADLLAKKTTYIKLLLM